MCGFVDHTRPWEFEMNVSCRIACAATQDWRRSGVGVFFGNNPTPYWSRGHAIARKWNVLQDPEFGCTYTLPRAGAGRDIIHRQEDAPGQKSRSLYCVQQYRLLTRTLFSWDRALSVLRENPRFQSQNPLFEKRPPLGHYHMTPPW